MLFIIGDIIEKGPESLKTLRYVMDICKKYMVYTLIGNVDAWRLTMFEDGDAESNEELLDYIIFMKERWGGCFFSDMCDELNFCISAPSDIPEAKQRIRKSFNEEFEFLRSLPIIIETQNFIFVHGGLPTDDIDSLVGDDAFNVLKIDAFIKKNLYFPKYVIVGHWPVTLYGDPLW
ncbi:MAG: hypothetical protein GX818_09185 [Tissierellia bacterium]|nr:hypothetical protein [Tissierellia bacterium]